MKLYWPVKPWDGGQPFGEKNVIYTNMGLLGHNGVDEPCPTGTPVYAAHDGVVTFCGHDGSAGLGVVVRGEGDLGPFKTIYWHLKEGGIQVKPDQKVQTGDLLAYSNNTGMSTGPHLHFGMKFIAQGEEPWIWFNKSQDNGYHGAVDPKPYFTGEYAVDRKTFNLQTKVVELLQALIALLQKRGRT